MLQTSPRSTVRLQKPRPVSVHWTGQKITFNMKVKSHIVFMTLLQLLLLLSLSCKKDKDNNNDNNITITPGPDVIDIDSNLYHSVTIGTQTWLTENLKVKHYRDGVLIPNVIDSTLWGANLTGARCYYNNDSITYADTYGALYNWYAVANSSNICPTGWHMPSKDEWSVLITNLGGYNIAADKMKETGTAHWLSPNANATNESGFTALPGGFRRINNTFDYLGGVCFFWAAKYGTSGNSFYNLCGEDSEIYNDIGNKPDGFSVRCIKD
ncbi:MAG: fibrobacter succinogenes major paralogous domain-containing protein [bacterium]